MKINPFFPILPGEALAITQMASRIECGFPSPADDHAEADLDLNQHLISHPAATYFAKASGDSLTGHGIYDGDLLIVNRAAPRRNGSVVVVSLDGQLTCKVMDLKNRCFRSSNAEYPPIPIVDEMDVLIEGVVTHAVHYLGV